MTKAQQAERTEALARLQEWLRPGDTVYTILRHVSRSGMQRTIAPVVFLDGRADNPRFLYWNVALALGMTPDRHREGVKVGGGGMDMGFHLVYELSARLFPNGFGCIGEGCPSSDHSIGDRDYTTHVSCSDCTDDDGDCDTCKGKGAVLSWHRDGGYALRQRWL